MVTWRNMTIALDQFVNSSNIYALLDFRAGSQIQRNIYDEYSSDTRLVMLLCASCSFHLFLRKAFGTSNYTFCPDTPTSGTSSNIWFQFNPLIVTIVYSFCRSVVYCIFIEEKK